MVLIIISNKDRFQWKDKSGIKEIDLSDESFFIKNNSYDLMSVITKNNELNKA